MLLFCGKLPTDAAGEALSSKEMSRNKKKTSSAFCDSSFSNSQISWTQWVEKRHHQSTTTTAMTQEARTRIRLKTKCYDCLWHVFIISIFPCFPSSAGCCFFRRVWPAAPFFWRTGCYFCFSLRGNHGCVYVGITAVRLDCIGWNRIGKCIYVFKYEFFFLVRAAGSHGNTYALDWGDNSGNYRAIVGQGNIVQTCLPGPESVLSW